MQGRVAIIAGAPSSPDNGHALLSASARVTLGVGNVPKKLHLPSSRVNFAWYPCRLLTNAIESLMYLTWEHEMNSRVGIPCCYSAVVMYRSGKCGHPRWLAWLGAGEMRSLETGSKPLTYLAYLRHGIQSPCQWLVWGWACDLILANSSEGKLMGPGKVFLGPKWKHKERQPFPCPRGIASANAERKAAPRDAHRLNNSLCSFLDPALSLSFRLEDKKCPHC